MSNQREKLAALTTVVADTGDPEALHTVQDATTNPSLLLQVANNDKYSVYPAVGPPAAHQPPC